MKNNLFVYLICVLIAALLAYAAIAKLVDYYNFQFGLSESPLIAPLAPVLAWALPAGELLIAAMLLYPRLQLIGLYLSLVLLVLFTVYIAGMLLFALDIPCSCGGVLEEMSWPQHIVFNCAFVLLNLYALFRKRKNKKLRYREDLKNVLYVSPPHLH